MNHNKKFAQARAAAFLCNELGKTFLELMPNRPKTDVSEWYIEMAKRLDTAESAREVDPELASIYASLKQGRGGPMDGYAINEDGSVNIELSRYFRDLIEELQGTTRIAWLKGVFRWRNREPMPGDKAGGPHGCARRISSPKTWGSGSHDV